MAKEAVEITEAEAKPKKKYRALNGIAHNPTGKAWQPGEEIDEKDLPAKTLADLIKSGDVQEVE